MVGTMINFDTEEDIIIDALAYYIEMLREDPIPRTEDKNYTLEDVQELWAMLAMAN